MASTASRVRGGVLVVMAVAALALGVWLGLGKNRPAGPGNGASITELNLPDILDQPQSGEQWLGKVVVVNHWATWCPPCVKEIPLLIDTQDELGPEGLQVVGIAHDTREAARVFGDQIGIDYPSLVVMAGGGELLKAQGNEQPGALPFTAFFDRDGNLAATKLGLLEREELRSIVEPLL